MLLPLLLRQTSKYFFFLREWCCFQCLFVWRLMIEPGKKSFNMQSSDFYNCDWVSIFWSRSNRNKRWYNHFLFYVSSLIYFFRRVKKLRFAIFPFFSCAFANFIRKNSLLVVPGSKIFANLPDLLSFFLRCNISEISKRLGGYTSDYFLAIFFSFWKVKRGVFLNCNFHTYHLMSFTHHMFQIDKGYYYLWIFYFQTSPPFFIHPVCRALQIDHLFF